VTVTRRIVLAILATTVAALVLAGLGTLVLSTVGARREAQAELRGNARDLASGLAEVVATDRPVAQVRPVLLRALQKALGLEDLGVVLVGPNGGVQGELPADLTLDELGLDRLLAGEEVSGRDGDTVYAAAAAPVGRSHVVVVLTRTIGSGTGRAAGWFLLSSAVVVAGAAVVAVWLGRRLARPVVQADEAARRIASGDLSTRVPDPKPGADDEPARLARSVNAMAAELERARATDQRFLLSVSHDLRTPLTSIRGYAEGIADGAADPAWAAGVILRETARLERLVADLLDLSRLESRSFTLRPEDLDLADVAAAVVDGFRPDAASASLVIQVEAPVPVPVRADPDRLAQVVANLVQNALKFARTTVQVSASAHGGSAVLRVDDDGPGIAPEDLTHVFERLYVSRHQPARKEAGSGLGLAIVRELAEASQGSVAAAPSPLGGARLEVVLPLRAG
jgi:signal transduction histidine kinase